MQVESRRSRRGMAGLLAARLPDLRFDEVEDVRARRGKRWALATILKSVVVGMASGCRSLSETEALTAEMASALRRLVQIQRRVPDTTARDALEGVHPSEVRRSLRAQVKAAHRRKSLTPECLPFGVAAMDGKSVTTEVWDDHYAQQHESEQHLCSVGLARTVTCTLVSARSKPCIEAIPIPASTNEMGHFRAALEVLDNAYGGLKLFRMVTYDAGACSEENAAEVRARGLHYLFAIKLNQPQILELMERRLGGLPPNRAVAETVDVLGNDRVTTRRLYLFEDQPLHRWSHARMFLRVESETVHRGKVVREDRYFLSSLPREELTDGQWLHVVRLHWGVENNNHWVWDAPFAEDDRPWIRTNPRATVVLMVLRRIAYNLLALHRAALKSDEGRTRPWRQLMRWLYNTVIALLPEQAEGLRERPRVSVAS